MLFLRQFTRRIIALPRVLTKADRLTIGVLAIAIGVGIVGLVGKNNFDKKEIPITGGTIRLGIVADSSTNIDRDIETITHAGLLKFDDKGTIQPSLAKKWEIQNDGKTYHFELVDGFSATQAKNILIGQKGFAHVQINAPDDKTLELQLKQAFSPLLADLTKPLFPIGFYEITKRNANTVSLKKRSTPLGEAYIDTITIDIFSSQKSLADALNQRRVDAGIASGDFATYQKFFLELPRYQVVFFNLSRPMFASKKTRQDLKTQVGLQGISFELTTVDSQILSNIAHQFNEDLKKRDAIVKLKTVSQKTLENEIMPKHDFDALLITIDLGRDPDTYSFWHSSQIDQGQNLSTFVNKRADRILEDARLTTDDTKRKQLYNELQAILDDEVPAIFLNQEKLQYNVNNRIKGVVIGKGTTPADRFGNIKDWYIKSKRVTQ